MLVSAEILSAFYANQVRQLKSETEQETLLTPRQRDCLGWVRQGKSSAEIGTIMGISVLTVDEHIAKACRKLGVRTRVQAAVEATVAGMID